MPRTNMLGPEHTSSLAGVRVSRGKRPVVPEGPTFLEYSLRRNSTTASDSFLSVGVGEKNWKTEESLKGLDTILV